MSKADAMFKELGYEKQEDEISVKYSKNNGEVVFVEFYKEFQEYEIIEDCSVTLLEHLAIHEKIKELV